METSKRLVQNSFSRLIDKAAFVRTSIIQVPLIGYYVKGRRRRSRGRGEGRGQECGTKWK
jgi:hypothetical protein